MCGVNAAAVKHPLFARVWALVLTRNEPDEVRGHRDELLAGLAGRVIEVGAGAGANFARYPPGVTEVVAVEPEPYLRERAHAAAASAPVPVTVVDGLADALPAPDRSFDAAVACLMLCSVPDQATALAEMHRVLRPGGELRFYEHVRAPAPRMARVQELVDRTFWPRTFGGCHTARDTVAAIAAAGFAIERRRDMRLESVPSFLPVATHAIGVARRA
jgi:ubiquinone/menaquinone biosynthesis C-methylase UbiE